MAVSVRMDPLLEKELEVAAKRRGVTKSQFIVDAVQTALGRKNPYELLLRVEQEMAPYRVGAPKGRAPRAAPSTGEAGPSHHERFRAALRAKHEAELRDWQAHNGITPAAKKSAARKNSGKGSRA
jgi:hypothetical protein